MFNSNKFDSLVNKYKDDKLSHAYLIESNNLDKVYADILLFIKMISCPFEYKDKCDNKECNLCNLIDKNQLPSLIVIEPESLNIKIDQILDLKAKFSTKPVYSKYNIYVIKQAEKMNSSSANALLKFLEEPEDDILGFFITNNSEKVISTIKSRCQTIVCNFEENSDYNDEVLDQVKIYLNSIYNKSDDLLYNLELIDLYKDRADWENFFKIMLLYFKDCYFDSRKDKVPLVKECSKDNLIKIMDLVENVLKYIVSNVNIELILDKFVLEMRNYYG